MFVTMRIWNPNGQYVFDNKLAVDFHFNISDMNHMNHRKFMRQYLIMSCAIADSSTTSNTIILVQVSAAMYGIAT